MYHHREDAMPVHIANPTVVAKIERLAVLSGLTKTAAVEKAVDAMLATRAENPSAEDMARFNAILEQFDRIPDLPNPVDPFDWDENGLPW
jgi:antitoxin VapB